MWEINLALLKPHKPSLTFVYFCEWNMISGLQSATDCLCFTALFNSMQTKNSKLYRLLRFTLPSINCSAAHPSFRLRPTRGKPIVEHSSDNETVLDSSRKLGGAVGRLIDSGENRNCRLTRSWPLNFRVRILLKGAIRNATLKWNWQKLIACNCELKFAVSSQRLQSPLI